MGSIVREMGSIVYSCIWVKWGQSCIPVFAERPLHWRPRCGRNGIEHAEPETLFFVHVQGTEVLGDGMLTEPRDCCRLTTAIVA